MFVAPHANSNRRQPTATGSRETGRRDLSVVQWNGRAPTDLIAEIEAQLALGARFAVLAPSSPLGREPDRALLEGWWRAIQVRLAAHCVGWAILVPGADVDPGLLGRETAATWFAAFPVHRCADRAEALRWLRAQLIRRDTAARAQ